ncbi:hypothetical protein P0D69_26105 [Paraburkholderia sediminicola]|uniref:hypothetical protein n=1 Tax=Paraburkholderia sediminicola TaxID=458836 RepID=UPI0038B6E5A1
MRLAFCVNEPAFQIIPAVLAGPVIWTPRNLGRVIRFLDKLIICNLALTEDFAFHLKQRGGMFAKGRLLGIQFQELFGVKTFFFENARHANAMAAKLASGILSGAYALEAETATNQVFAILPDSVISALTQHFAFYVWRKSDNDHSVICPVTSWATQECRVDAFLARPRQEHV